MKLFVDSTLPTSIKSIFKQDIFELIFYDAKKAKLSQDVDVIICRANTKIDQLFIGEHQVKVVATASSGSDHIDKIFLANRGIKWIDAKGANALAVAEYLYHLVRHENFPPHKKHFGIIGCGHVGQQVESLFLALGYKVTTFDPPRARRDKTFTSAKLIELYQASIISLHVPLIMQGKDKTLNLINQSFLNKLKLDAIVINSSRGEVVDENCLSYFPTMHFCFDVFKNEPNLNSSTVEQCLFATPHIAGHTIEAKSRALALIHQQLLALFNLPAQSNSLASHEPQSIDINHRQLRYNPGVDTKILKQNTSAESFIEIRKQHYRHELSMQKLESKCC